MKENIEQSKQFADEFRNLLLRNKVNFSDGVFFFKEVVLKGGSVGKDHAYFSLESCIPSVEMFGLIEFKSGKWNADFEVSDSPELEKIREEADRNWTPEAVGNLNVIKPNAVDDIWQKDVQKDGYSSQSMLGWAR